MRKWFKTSMMLEALTHSDWADLIYNVDFSHSFMN